MPERPKAQDLPADEQEMRQITDLFTGLEEGFNQKDPTMLDHQFTSDAVMIAPDGTMVQGWDDLIAYHTERLNEPASDWKTRFSIIDVNFINQDIAIVFSRQETTTPNGEIINQGTTVLTHKNGNWWICAMQSTNVQ